MGSILPQACFKNAPEPTTSRTTEEYRLVLAGGAGVGKSSMLKSICLNQHSCEYEPTLHVQVGVKTVEINDEAVVTIHLWDTPGAPQVDLSNMIYDKADGVVMMFDISDKDSWLELPNMLDNIRAHLPTSAPILLCANKADQEPHVADMAALRRFARSEFLCGIVYTSPLDGAGTRTALKHLVRETRASKDTGNHLRTKLAVGWSPTGTICGGCLFGDPLPQALELEASRGLQAQIPLVIDLAIQALTNLADPRAFELADQSDRRRIVNYVEFLMVLSQQDIHGIILEINKCTDAKVIGQLLIMYARRLPSPLIPQSVYTAYMTGARDTNHKDGQSSVHQTLRATAAVASIQDPQKQLLKAICQFLHGFSGRDAGIQALESVLCGGFDDDRNKELRSELLADEDSRTDHNGNLVYMLTMFHENVLW